MTEPESTSEQQEQAVEDQTENPQAKGGRARAEVLGPARRRAIAKEAASIRWARVRNDGELLKATHNGELPIGSAILRCSVLEDGTRVLSQRTFTRALGRRGNLKVDNKTSDVFQPPEFLAAANLKPFLPDDLEVSSRPVLYAGQGGVNIGYRAELLPVVCQIYQDARDARVLHQSQMAIAEACKMLFRGFATVGIVALVDEATGYQEVRDRLALQKILEAYLARELAAWAKCFPTEFYKEMFRLRKWTFDELRQKQGKGAGPRVAGKYTNDIVYARLAPGILEELQRRNPSNEKGQRRAKHHQWLTSDVGHPALAQHLHAVIGLMRASESWDQFQKLLNRAFPRRTNISDLPLFNQAVPTKESGQDDGHSVDARRPKAS